jgi:hypothetical protein
MATGAISGLSMGLYIDDLDDPSVEFSQIALTNSDGGLYQDYQAASGYRYWDPAETLLIEKQIHGTGEWVAAYPDKVWWTSGKVHFDTPLNNDDTVRATGKRRDNTNFTKIMNLTRLTIRSNGKTLDSTSVEDAGWESAIAGMRSFEGTSEEWFYFDEITYPDKPMDKFLTPLYAKFYSNYSAAKLWGGKVLISNYEIIDNLNAPQKQTLRFTGTQEMLPELT